MLAPGWKEFGVVLAVKRFMVVVRTQAACHNSPMTNVSPPPLATVADLGRQAILATDVQPLLTRAANVIVQHLGVELSSILELMPDGTALFQAGTGWRAGVVGKATVELGGRSAAGHVIRSQAAVAISDLAGDRCFSPSSLLAEHSAASSLLVPLLGRNRPLGVVGAHGLRPREFTADEISWLQAVANAIAVAIERQWMPRGQADERLLRAEQMMAIGQVAAGVAHELRNPLTSIKGLVQVNLRELEAHGLPTEDLAVIEHEIRRMERTLQTFLDFARPPQPERRRLDLATVARRVLELVGGRARKQQVALRFSGPPEPVQADVDADQIQQLLLNLVLNALDAMPLGGAIEIELQPPRDGQLALSVSDTGPGVAAHILPRCSIRS